jgi:tight adherence protein B
VVLSDGADTASRAGTAAVLSKAKSTDARVFSVALESPEFSAEALGSLSRKTGGTLLRTSDSAELSGLFEDLASTLASSYRLTFTDPDPFASRLDIAVTVDPDGVALGGFTSLDLDVMAESASGTTNGSFLNVPLPLLVLGVFLIVAIVMFTLTDVMRSSRKSPLRRLPWYVAKKQEKAVDPAHFVNAAVVKRAQAIATSMAGKTGYLKKLDQDIDAAALRWKAGEVLLSAFLFGVGGVVLGAIFLKLPGAIFFGLIGSLGVLARVKRRASKRRKAFYNQLPDVLMLLSGSLRAGYSLQQAIMAVGEDAQAPASEEFKRAMAEVRLGSSADDSLKALALRIGIPDVDWTVQAIQIHNEVGGNLAEILETIAGTIRERARVKRHLNALTAEGKLSALILGLLPFILLGLVLLVNRTYLEPLFTTTMGWVMLAGSLGMMLIGFAWMRKIIRIEV